MTYPIASRSANSAVKSKAIGGYVRRSERRYVPPAPPAEMNGPNWHRHFVLPTGGVITIRMEPPSFEMPVFSPRFEMFGEEE